MRRAKQNGVRILLRSKGCWNFGSVGQCIQMVYDEMGRTVGEEDGDVNEGQSLSLA